MMPAVPRRASRPARRAAAALIVAGALAGCTSGGGSDADPQGAAPPSAEDTTTTEAPKVPARLTGLVLEDPSVADRPAVVVKVDNGPEARPQAGLDRADILIEEKVEGGISRFLAVFHSADAELVGPVRSVRSTDPPLIAPIGGVFAYAGGIPEFESMARSAPVTVLSESRRPDAFRYREDRRRPFKTYASTSRLRSLGGGRSQPPPRLLELLAPGEAFDPPGATPATHASVAFGRTTATWDYDPTSKLWQRSTDGAPHVLEGGGKRLAFTNLIIQRTSYRSTRFRDPSGAKVDEAAVVGSGEAVILAAGKQIAARWSKPSLTAVTTYTDLRGGPIRLPPGRTWVGLPPLGSPLTIR